jgi:hypothetical protein
MRLLLRGICALRKNVSHGSGAVLPFLSHEIADSESIELF